MPLLCIQLEIYFHWERILCGQLFSFYALKMLFRSLLPCLVSNEQPAVIFIFVPLGLMCLFSPGTFRFFSLSIALSNLIMMCLDVVFSLFVLGICWTFKICSFTVCIKKCLLRFLQVLFFPPFLQILSFEDSNVTYIRLLEVVAQLVNASLFFSHLLGWFLLLCVQVQKYFLLRCLIFH